MSETPEDKTCECYLTGEIVGWEFRNQVYECGGVSSNIPVNAVAVQPGPDVLWVQLTTNPDEARQLFGRKVSIHITVMPAD